MASLHNVKFYAHTHLLSAFQLWNKWLPFSSKKEFCTHKKVPGDIQKCRLFTAVVKRRNRSNKVIHKKSMIWNHFNVQMYIVSKFMQYFSTRSHTILHKYHLFFMLQICIYKFEVKGRSLHSHLADVYLLHNTKTCVRQAICCKNYIELEA